MSTPEYVEFLKAQRNQILRNLSDFTMSREAYQVEVNRLKDVDQRLAFYGL